VTSEDGRGVKVTRVNRRGGQDLSKTTEVWNIIKKEVFSTGKGQQIPPAK